MPAALWIAYSLPVIAGMLHFYFTAREKAFCLAAKGCATCIALITALVGQSKGGGLPAGEWIIAAAAIFLAADILLEIKFLPGVAAFALGHMALMRWLSAQEAVLHQNLLTVLSISIAVVLYAASVLPFRRVLKDAGKNAMAMLPYAAVLAGMTAVAVTLPYFGGCEYLFFAAGAVLFMISDLMVARGILIGMKKRGHVTAMILYESAVLLMALSCWKVF